MATNKLEGAVEFEFPDEIEDKNKKPEAQEPEIQVVDDTPPDDQNRKPLNREVSDPDDAELDSYSEQVKSRIKVEKVIIGYLFPVKLIENQVRFAIEYTLLMRILSVTQRIK